MAFEPRAVHLWVELACLELVAKGSRVRRRHLANGLHHGECVLQVFQVILQLGLLLLKIAVSGLDLFEFGSLSDRCTRRWLDLGLLGSSRFGLMVRQSAIVCKWQAPKFAYIFRLIATIAA